MQEFRTYTSHWIDIDLIAILHRYVEENITTHFHIISTYFFWCNFDGRWIDVVLTYFIQCNLIEQKLDVFRVTFFDLILMDKKNDIVSTYFLSNFDGKLMGIRGADFDLFLKDQNLLSFRHHFLKSLCYIKNLSRA